MTKHPDAGTYQRYIKTRSRWVDSTEDASRHLLLRQTIKPTCHGMFRIDLAYTRTLWSELADGRKTRRWESWSQKKKDRTSLRPAHSWLVGYDGKLRRNYSWNTASDDFNKKLLHMAASRPTKSPLKARRRSFYKDMFHMVSQRQLAEKQTRPRMCPQFTSRKPHQLLLLESRVSLVDQLSALRCCCERPPHAGRELGDKARGGGDMARFWLSPAPFRVAAKPYRLDYPRKNQDRQLTLPCSLLLFPMQL